MCFYFTFLGTCFLLLCIVFCFCWHCHAVMHSILTQFGSVQEEKADSSAFELSGGFSCPFAA